MTSLDDLFAAGLARQSDAVAEPDFVALESTVLGKARSKQRTRVAVNVAATVVASAVVASVAWASTHTVVTPSESTPTPSEDIVGALPEPTLNPVWDDGLYPVNQPLPQAFAETVDLSSLTLAERPGPSYPAAYEIADRVWDDVRGGWSMQTWRGPADTDPVMLYLVSPSGTFFKVRQLDDFEGGEHWYVQSWSAHPARATLQGYESNTENQVRLLVDLRTGRVLRAHADTGPNQGSDDTVLAGGFSEGRSLQVEFERDRGYSVQDLGLEGVRDVRVRIVSPDGSSTTVPGIPQFTSLPAVTSAGADGRYAVIFSSADDELAVIDLDTATATVVIPSLGVNEGCTAYGVLDAHTVAAHCFVGDTPSDVTFSLETGELLTEELASGRDLQGIDVGVMPMVDTATDTEIDIMRAPELMWDPAVAPIGGDQFAIDAARRLLVFDRASGESYVVVGDLMADSRTSPGILSIAVLPDRTAGERAPLVLGENSWY
ncbi:hypothetical protein [Demequina sp.]|uniref:hypothetical protein n=1 Tax=Demequina sp. TaxID=2050685 RepID=UPI003D0AB9B2